MPGPETWRWTKAVDLEDSAALLHLQAGRVQVTARLAGAAERGFERHGQSQRRPNEAADRTPLAAGLAARISSEDIERLHVEDERMSTTDIATTAYAF